MTWPQPPDGEEALLLCGIVAALVLAAIGAIWC